MSLFLTFGGAAPADPGLPWLFLHWPLDPTDLVNADQQCIIGYIEDDPLFLAQLPGEDPELEERDEGLLVEALAATHGLEAPIGMALEDWIPEPEESDAGAALEPIAATFGLEVAIATALEVAWEAETVVVDAGGEAAPTAVFTAEELTQSPLFLVNVGRLMGR